MKPIMFAIMFACGVSAVVLISATAQMGGAHPSKRPKLPPASAPHRPSATAGPQFGQPLDGLDADQLAAFTDGRGEFEAVETPEGGLGPIFNNSSCVACHSAGATGGASDQKVTRFGRLVNGRFDSLEDQGGSLLQSKAIDPAVAEHVPTQANVVALRITTPLFGTGLIEAIADDEIERNALRGKPDGVTGRAHKVFDIASGQMRVGRFGWKAQHASVLSFAADAYVNEMGITSRFFPTENAPNGRTDLLAKFDKVADVEDSVDPVTGKSDIDHAADFVRLLAPPPGARTTANAQSGQRVFEQVRCTACHLPVLFTADNPIRALAHQPVRLYSDLLLHDMGRLGDGIVQGGASGREMRTAPLWGLRVRPAYLHDGRAATVHEAITQHDGEAARSRELYMALSPAEQQQLIEFLKSI